MAVTQSSFLLLKHFSDINSCLQNEVFVGFGLFMWWVWLMPLRSKRNPHAGTSNRQSWTSRELSYDDSKLAKNVCVFSQCQHCPLWKVWMNNRGGFDSALLARQIGFHITCSLGYIFNVFYRLLYVFNITFYGVVTLSLLYRQYFTENRPRAIIVNKMSRLLPTHTHLGYPRKPFFSRASWGLWKLFSQIKSSTRDLRNMDHLVQTAMKL